MNNSDLQTVKINIGSNMYSRFPDLPNTVPHVLAEFIDNALQSYYDNKEVLKQIEENFELCVHIDIDWDETTERAQKITVTDNAAGINEKSYKNAFMPAKTPDNNTGLNEFGMGLKTAALWLGENWVVKTKAINESIERTISFNLNEVTANDLEELPIETTSKNILEHYTVVIITELTKNAPAKKTLEKIKRDIASIYRKSLRTREMKIVVCGDVLTFTEYPILVSPPANNLSAPPVVWKKDIDFSFFKYKAKGFVGILRDIDSTKNGFALLRRGRVIVGAEVDGRYFPKALSGSVGTFRYKRLFGELELEGFDVSFNKNDIQDKENLDALMTALKDEIHSPEFDLYNQAEDYRLNESQKAINKLVKKHNNQRKDAQPITVNKEDVSNDTVKQKSQDSDLFNQDAPIKQPEIILGETSDDYKIDGTNVKLKVEFINTGEELFWIDVSKKSEGVITCKINTEHDFFRHFGKPTAPVIAIIKTIAISKFATKEKGNDTTAEMLNWFNNFIKQTKV